MFGAAPFGDLPFGDAPSADLSGSVDRWWRQFAEPARFPRRLPTHSQQFSAFVKADPFPEAVSEDRWHQPFAVPVKFPRRLPTNAQQFSAFVKASPFPEAVSEDRWHQPFSVPVKFPRRLPTYAQQFMAMAPWPLFEPFQIAFLGSGILEATFSNSEKDMLSDQTARFIYTAEIHPWFLQG